MAVAKSFLYQKGGDIFLTFLMNVWIILLLSYIHCIVLYIHYIVLYRIILYHIILSLYLIFHALYRIYIVYILLYIHIVTFYVKFTKKIFSLSFHSPMFRSKIHKHPACKLNRDKQVLSKWKIRIFKWTYLLNDPKVFLL